MGKVYWVARVVGRCTIRADPAPAMIEFHTTRPEAWMAVSLVPLLSDSYLRRCWNADFEAFEASPAALDLLGRLRNWAGKPFQPESEASGAFVGVFFKGLWGHVAAGEQAAGTRFTCWPEFPVRHAGPTGSIGKADLALGFFEPGSADPIPQVLCEFKDVHSCLDTPRLRKGHSRSPVAQAFAYLREAREGRAGPFRPNWALVTDMNEFRLYAFGRPDQ